VAGVLQNEYGDAMPRVSVAEPEAAACLFESVRHGDGLPHAASGSGRTIMAGLNCGEPCTIAWPILRGLASEFFCLSRQRGCRGHAHTGKHRVLGDPRIVSGESGAVTAGLLSRIAAPCGAGALRDRMGLGKDAVVLLFSTEGDTDPENYKDIVGNIDQEK
jgi:diaminopropionate ammonia-lyase